MGTARARLIEGLTDDEIRTAREPDDAGRITAGSALFDALHGYFSRRNG